MEDRYEIRGKIGQGGIGSVYRGYDLRMNREVAIKRISSSPEDATLQEEATKQLLSEAGALASLQHPHIVTVYDVGADEDGPYVVMELISGKTLDEIIENAPLTWPDFRELAMQTQEALIAAQDLDMIHSDLKPPNIMLTWLPSGKFQVKIVDFGLAVLTQSQSQEEIESLDAVFGSIFFMPPEQFERQVLDARSDLYSMGCVYYQALTGTYPFRGQTGNEVMAAHLNHTVKPIQDLRADIPLWVCDWVMWMINRQRTDRPENARVALSVFLLNDKNPNPEMSRGAVQVKRPRMITNKATPQGAHAPAGPQPLVAPDGRSSVHSASTATSSVQTSPQALAAPSGVPNLYSSPASVATSSVDSRAHTVSPEPAGTQRSHATPVVAVDPAKQKAKAAKQRMMFIVGGAIAVVVACLAVVFLKANKRNQIHNRIVTLALAADTKEIPMTGDELQIMLDSVASPDKVGDDDVLYKSLVLARSSDGTDVDAVICDFATGLEMKDVRLKLISVVIKERANAEIIPQLMNFASTTDDEAAAVATYAAMRGVVKPEHVQDHMDVIVKFKSQVVRDAVEANLMQIVNGVRNRQGLADYFVSSYKSAKDENVRHVLIRLLVQCGTFSALEQLKKVFMSGEESDQIVAGVALSRSKDAAAQKVLADFYANPKSATVRKAIESQKSRR